MKQLLKFALCNFNKEKHKSQENTDDYTKLVIRICNIYKHSLKILTHIWEFASFSVHQIFFDGLAGFKTFCLKQIWLIENQIDLC